MKTLEDAKLGGIITNTIYNSDCLELLHIIPENFIDLVITSPPYDNLRDYKGYLFDFKNIAKELFRIIKIGGVVVWIVNDATINGSETGTSFKQALYFKDVGFNLHDTMIWNKQECAMTSNNRYDQGFEYMFILSKNKPHIFNPIMDKKNKSSGTKVHGTIRQKDGTILPRSRTGQIIKEFGKRYNVWNIAPEKYKSQIYKHPAMFSEQLVHDHIISWSNIECLILDPFCGSGTTCKIAASLKRNYIGIDISKEYCEISENRLKEIQYEIL